MRKPTRITSILTILFVLLACFFFYQDSRPIHAQLGGNAGFQYRKITTNVCTQIIGSTGQLHEVFVSSPGTTWTIQVFDNAAACSGTAIIGATAITVPAAGTVWQFDIQANSGIAVLTAGTTPGEITVAFR